MPSEKDICLTCGVPIEVETLQMGIFGRCKRGVCDACAYESYRRSETCCRRPFKSPYLRQKADGSLPEEFLAYVHNARVPVE